MYKKKPYDVVIIGSGPGGIAAAIAAKQAGADDVLVIERDIELGGILLQCIHNGFGLEMFGDDLPGPAYAQHFVNQAIQTGVDYLLDTMVLEITRDLRIFASNNKEGFLEIQASAVVLAMGCRERSRAQIQIPGSRPAGVYTAGTAQRWVNVEGYLPGERCVILGSGDIGLIMARRMTLEGAKVERVVELLPYINGLTRNYVQCILDYDIPLQRSHTVKRILGNEHIEAVVISEVDEKLQFIEGTEETISCDTLLLSVGLIPENELSRNAGVIIDPITSGPVVDDKFQTNIPGVFAAGNVVHVYDLADWVTKAGFKAGENAAAYALSSKKPDENTIQARAGELVRYVVPQKICKDSLEGGEVKLQLRVTQPIEEPVWVQVMDGEKMIKRKYEPYARPGEMIEITLKQDVLQDLFETEQIMVNVIRRKA